VDGTVVSNDEFLIAGVAIGSSDGAWTTIFVVADG